MEINTNIKIGRSVIEKTFEYYKASSMDDESELVPLLTLIIEGILENSEDKENDKYNLDTYAKQLYVHNVLISKGNDDDDEYTETKLNDDIQDSISQMEQVFEKL